MGERVLVGCTGFVGGNLAAKGDFTAQYHSTDVQNGFGKETDLLVYAGVPAAMFLANQNPEADLAIMRAARENIRRFAAKQTVLISSICVYADSKGKTETDLPTAEGLAAYGANRLLLEQWVREDNPNALIIRLPALYGLGLKKNFLYDLHTLTPALLRPDKYEALCEAEPMVKERYQDAGNGFYRCVSEVAQKELRPFFAANDFNALCFTDARSNYQFYDLRRLWGDIQIALANALTVLHLVTPPLSAGDVYRAVVSEGGGQVLGLPASFTNELAAQPFDYDLKTNYAALFGGKDHYLCGKEAAIGAIKTFMKEWV